jgi:thiol:disulfide interchange protein
MFKKSILFFSGLLLFINAFSQVLKPISWKFSTSVSHAKIGDEIELIFTATIDNRWYLYSSDFDKDLGPIVTEFTFEPDKSYQRIGDIVPVHPKQKYDSLWGGNYTYFVGKGEFRQKVKILSTDFKVTGTFDYQVCSEIDGKCINFDDDFVFNQLQVTAGKESGSVKPGQDKTQETESANASTASANAGTQDTTSQLTGLSPSKIQAIPLNTDSLKVSETTPAGKKSILMTRSSNDPYTLLAFMVIAFLGGLAALLTPCVFPMIPMTVSFFTGRAKTRRQGIRNALIYGFSIIIIYTVIGSVLAPFMGPDTANFLATHWLPNTVFFIVFIVFALSFFGLFEINLPTGFVNKIDKRADKGGIAGIFFMALTLVLISFSCTGPIVGSILVESAGGMILKPILGMFAFSLSFAIPFTLFAIFPEWISNLPKSGGWLNSVKVVLGFLEFAFAFKFLSIADQAYHWHILDREVYLAIWIVTFTLMGFYILGKIRLPHDSKADNLSVIRLMLAILIFSFVTYLIPGMFGAPLKALSGYLPPITTQDFNLPGQILNAESHSVTMTDNSLCAPPKYSDLLEFPLGIKGYFDYKQAIECAREKHKPLFIDFTGHGCVNCREMEARVWSDPEVLRRLKNDFIMVALYVDDKTDLPENEWYTSTYDGKVKKTIGRQNADFQITRYNNNAQPFYVILDDKENMLAPPKAYDLNVDDFVNFLDQAKQKFKRD